MNHINDVTIFAVKRPGDSGEAEARKIKEALNRLDVLDIPYILGVGTYEGNHEICIVAFTRGAIKSARVAELAFFRFDQDCVLHLGDPQKNATREAVMENNLSRLPAGRRVFERVGYWKGVTAEHAEKSIDGSTFIPSMDQHYIAA